MTSENEKTLHQQSITDVDGAMKFAYLDRGPAAGMRVRAIVACETLAAEVRRLQAIAECAHEWVSYSRPPMRAVTGRQCKRCKMVDEPAVDEDPRSVEEAMAPQGSPRFPIIDPSDAIEAVPVLQGEVRRLREELERERMRLAGCGVAALGYFKDCIPEYDSASLQDTLRLYAEKERLRAIADSFDKVYDTHTNQLRETISVMSTNEGKLHAKIAELETERVHLRVHIDQYPEHVALKAKLARVEALPAKWREGKRRVAGEPEAVMHWADELEGALRD